MTTTMMKCGCVATGRLGNNMPVCSAHWGLTPDAEIIVAEPDLTGRVAKCGMCTETEDSSIKLPFFQHNKTQERDTYYCGCRGWS